MTQATPPGWYPDPSGAPGQRYFDGNEWSDHRADAPQPAAPVIQYVVAPPKRKIWPWVLGGIFLVILLGFGACAAFVGSVANEISKDSSVTVQPEPGQPSTGGSQTADSGLEFPGKQDGDTGVEAGGSATSDDVTTTSAPLSKKDEFGNTYLCTLVTIENKGTEQATFNTLFDWKLQDPSGTTKNASVAGADNFLGAGEIAPGGTAKGDVCFDSPVGAPSGTYVVLFDPTFSLSSSRIGWINRL